MPITYTFDDYAINVEAFEIKHRGRELAVEPQVFELLLMLIENRDRIVSKEELFARIWKDRIVSDATLSSRIKLARQLIGDDGTAQRLIRTIHGRGFRFVGELDGGPETGEGRAPPTDPVPIHPPTRYARSGDIHVAYHLFGGGSVNLVLAPGFVSHIDNYWDHPVFAAWLNHLATFARVAMFDKRGTGLSDPVSTLPGLDERMDDVRAVMDAAGFDKAVIMGISEGGSLASLFAASHPERTRALILYGAFARFTSWFPTEESLEQLFAYVERDWGSGKSLPNFAPSVAHDESFQRWWGKFERLGATPGAAIALMKMNSHIDVSDVLPSIQVPTLVIHRTGDVLIDIEAGRFLADKIRGSRYIELPGDDHLPYVGENASQILDSICDFLSTIPEAAEPESVLATVVVGSFSARHGAVGSRDTPDNLVSQQLDRFQGNEIKQLRDGFIATFDGPARALRCALAIVTALQSLDVEPRIGVHTGEVDLFAEDISGIAANLAFSIVGLAEANCVLVSRTVRDLVAGSRIRFDDFGIHAVSGVTEKWRLYRVTG